MLVPRLISRLLSLAVCSFPGLSPRLLSLAVCSFPGLSPRLLSLAVCSFPGLSPRLLSLVVCSFPGLSPRLLSLAVCNKSLGDNPGNEAKSLVLLLLVVAQGCRTKYGVFYPTRAKEGSTVISVRVYCKTTMCTLRVWSISGTTSAWGATVRQAIPRQWVLMIKKHNSLSGLR